MSGAAPVRLQRRLADTLRALLRAGFAEAVAYRSEMLVWILSTNVPLIMWLMWDTVAQEGAIGGYGRREFAGYFLMTLVVRMVTGAWVAWEMSEEVRSGAIAQRLMRPLHPFIAYAAENLAAFPLRIFVLAPLVTAALLIVGRSGFTQSPLQLLLAFVATALAWAIAFSAMAVIGTLALLWQRALSLTEAWFGLYFVFSGYTVPLDLFPPWLREAVRYSPFPYLIALPVQSFLGSITVAETARGLAVQLGYVGVFVALGLALFRRALARYQVFGG